MTHKEKAAEIRLAAREWVHMDGTGPMTECHTDKLEEFITQALQEAEARGIERAAELFLNESCIDHESGGQCVGGRILALKDKEQGR